MQNAKVTESEAKQGKPVGIDLITTLEFTTSKMSDHDAPDQSHKGEQENVSLCGREIESVCIYLGIYTHVCPLYSVHQYVSV